jgi:hypothetical protein
MTIDSGETGGLNPSVLRGIDKFYGLDEDDARSWLEYQNNLAQACKWSPETRLMVARMNLAGPAQVWAISRSFIDWNDFVAQFKQRFAERPEAFEHKLARCRQGQYESVKSYTDRFQMFAKRAGRSPDSTLTRQMVMGFLPHIRQKVVEQRLDDIENIVKYAAYLEEWELDASIEDPYYHYNSSNYAPPPPPPRGRDGARRDYNSRPGDYYPRRDFDRRFDQGDGRRPYMKPTPYHGGYNQPSWSDNKHSIDRPPFAGGYKDRPKPSTPAPYHNNQQPPPPSRPVQPVPPHAKATTTPDLAIDELTKRMGEMSINTVDVYKRMLAEKEKEIAYLRSKIDMDQPAPATINFMAVAGPLTAHDVDYYDHIYSNKRAAPDGGHTTYQRAPRMRTAVDPNSDEVRAALQSPSTAAAARRTTTPTTPLPTGPSGTAAAGPSVPYYPGRAGAARGPAAPRATAQGHGTNPHATSNQDRPEDRTDPVPVTAEILAEQKGKELANKACREIRVDGIRESATIIPAVKTCCAGYILGDRTLIERGRDLARRGDQHIRRLMGPPSPPVPGGATAAAAAAGPSRTVAAAMPADDSADVMSAGALSGNTTVCQAKVLANGREVDAVVDTGASHSVITRDLARKLGLQEEDNTKPVAFWNADGHLTSTTSIIRNIPVTIGPLTCKVDAFVTEAFNYDLLLGTDCLVPINATVCLKTRRLSFDLNTFTRSSVPITVSMGHAPSKYHYVNHTEVCEKGNECDLHDNVDADDADDCTQLNQAEDSPAATADCHETCT